MAKSGLTEEQKLKIQNIAGFRLLTLIAEDEVVGEIARQFPEALTTIFLTGCQAGCAATIEVIKDDLT